MTSNEKEILFDKFEIIDCFKKDPQAGVYFARHLYLDKNIILKTLDTKNIIDQTVLERFKREAKILAQLDHPNLIKVLDFGTYENFFYISFEFFESRNLRDVISQNNLTDKDRLNILVQLLKALNVAHQNNIVHRDIKPENILLNNDYHLKIADFGLALIQTDKNITQDFSVLGTPSYMSPEQLLGEKNLQGDIFSTGVVAYELFTGINPFNRGTVTETINLILNYTEDSGTIDFGKLPVSVRPAIYSMLRKNQKDRAKSVLEVLKLLGIEGDVYQPAEINKIKKITPKIYLTVFAFLILVLVGSYLVFYNSYENNVQSFQPSDNSKILIDSSLKGKFAPVESSTISVNNSKPAEINNNIDATDKNNTTAAGKLFVKCFPFADVYIDGIKMDTTPLKDYIELNAGKHLLKLIHPTFPAYENEIFIGNNQINSITVNFNEIVGYLHCNIYPWGEVSINGKSKGITPLPPIPLMPGNYKLVIKNPKYEPYSKDINIREKDTLKINFNFEK